MSSETDNIEYNRVIWHSRRGMLELDIVLEKFVRRRYPALSSAEQALYRRLLDCEDQELFDWFLKKREVDDPELAVMVNKILAFQAESTE
mgnify:FL=1